MWNSLPLLNALSLWALWAAAVFGGLTAITGLVGGLVATRASELTRNEAAIKIANANARAEEAKEEAARLKLEMERERIARLKLEEKVQPRKISPQQKTLMQTNLQNAPRNRVFLQPDWVDPEAKMYAAQIADVLEPIGFPLERLTGDDAPLSYGRLGTFLVINNGAAPPAHFKHLYEAFRAAGLILDVHAEPYVPGDSVLIGVSTR